MRTIRAVDFAPAVGLEVELSNVGDLGKEITANGTLKAVMENYKSCDLSWEIEVLIGRDWFVLNQYSAWSFSR